MVSTYLKHQRESKKGKNRKIWSMLELRIIFDFLFLYRTYNPIINSVDSHSKCVQNPANVNLSTFTASLSHRHLLLQDPWLPSSTMSPRASIYTEVRVIVLKEGLIMSFFSLQPLEWFPIPCKVKSLVLTLSHKALPDLVSLWPYLLLLPGSFTLLQPQWHAWQFPKGLVFSCLIGFALLFSGLIP